MRAALEREPKHSSRIEPVDRRPAIGAVSRVGRDTLLASKADDARYEAVLAVAVDGRWEPHHRRAHASGGQRAAHGEVVEHMRHPVLGPLAFEYSAFAVDGRTDLTVVVYNPATEQDAEGIDSLPAGQASA